MKYLFLFKYQQINVVNISNKILTYFLIIILDQRHSSTMNNIHFLQDIFSEHLHIRYTQSNPSPLLDMIVSICFFLFLKYGIKINVINIFINYQLKHIRYSKIIIEFCLDLAKHFYFNKQVNIYVIILLYLDLIVYEKPNKNVFKINMN